MSCKNCNETSSTTFSRCNPPISSNCTFYQGASLTCSTDSTFNVCKGESLTEVQKIFFDKICELKGEIDVTEIRFPCSFQEAWDRSDKTILELLAYLAQIDCTQQSEIDELSTKIDNINPTVSVCLQCCGEECGTVDLLLSDALNKIVDCLCAAKTQITALQNEVALISAGYNTLQSQIDSLKTFQTSQVTLNIDLQTRLSAVESKTSCLPEC